MRAGARYDMSIEQVRYFLFHVDFPYKTMLSNNRDFYKMTKTRIIWNCCFNKIQTNSVSYTMNDIKSRTHAKRHNARANKPNLKGKIQNITSTNWRTCDFKKRHMTNKNKDTQNVISYSITSLSPQKLVLKVNKSM